MVTAQDILQLKQSGDFTQARNGAIQKMLRMLGYGDNIGSGFHKIMTAWRNLGYPQPEIHEEAEVFEVWLTLPVPTDTTTANVTNDGGNGGNDVTNVTNDVTNVTNDGGKEIDLVRFVYNAIVANNQVTLGELTTVANTSERHIKRIIKKLKEDGYLTRQGSSRTGKWIVLNNKMIPK